ncbi:MAG: hypothetical protein U0103_14865 [Candidatus Obscuribacterales bacterium]
MFPFIMLGFYIYQFVPIMLIEAVVLWRLKWGSLRLSLLDSLLVNFASFTGLLLGLGPYITGSGIWGLTLFGTYSIMVEGAFLMLLERHTAKKVWLTILAANLASCIMLGIETIFTVPTKG